MASDAACPSSRYHVEQSQAERCELAALVGSGKHYARTIKRAQILLAADSGLSDDDIAAAVAKPP